MNLQENRVHFFDRLYSELSFSPIAPVIQEIINSINFSLPTSLVFHNVSSGETMEGPFFLEKNLLVYYQVILKQICSLFLSRFKAKTMESPMIMLDIAYARLHTKSGGSLKINLEKNQNSYEITFHDQNHFHDWMLKLRKICVLNNFEKKYQITEETKISRGRYDCLLETNMGGNHYSARKFDKKHVTGPENSLEMVRLMNKIEILKALRTERVLQLNEVYETEDSIYLVTDFAKKKTLKQFLKATSSSPLEVSKTQSIMHQLLKILSHLASKNIAHRNLKPASILMEEKDHIRIINFCLATFINSPKANVGICGTPGYIAPEILNCHHDDRVYDDKVDVFSAGCIFFEMIFGRPLFESSEPSEISTFNKNFRYSDLVTIVMKTKEQNQKCLLTKLSLDLLLKMLHPDPKQRISAQYAFHHGYFRSQEKSHSTDVLEEEDEDEFPTKNTQPNSPQSGCKKMNYDLSPTFSNSVKESFSEAVSSQGDVSTLHPGRDSIRKLSAEAVGRRTSTQSIFKNQPKTKSAEEMNLPIPPTGNMVLLNLKDSQNEEEGTGTGSIFDELSLGNLSKNFPIASPRFKKHPNQRV